MPGRYLALLTGFAVSVAVARAEEPAAHSPLPEQATAPVEQPCPPIACPRVACPCGPDGRYWVRGEYLAWWARGSRVPALATLSPPGTPVEQAGVLTAPGTQVLFGNERIDTGVRHGFRVRAGTWLDCDQTCGIEGGFFWVGAPPGGSFTAGDPTGNAVIGRPYTGAVTGLPSAELVSFPGVLAGFVSVNTSSQFLGVDAAVRHRLCCVIDECDPCDPCARKPGYRRLDLLLGYRFFGFRDRVTINENLFPTDPESVPGTNIRVRDDFEAQNWFHGGMIGLAAERSWGRCYVAGEVRLNLGAVVREVNIRGQTVVTVPGDVPAVNTGGLLALPSNIGTYRSSEFAAVPEFDLRAGYQITSRLRGFVGYTLIIWPHVARAGEQIDPVVNPFLIPPPIPNPPGPARPAFLNRTSTLWVQGVSAGLEYRW